MHTDDLFALRPFEQSRRWRETSFQRLMSQLTRHHATGCSAYGLMLDAMGVDPRADLALSDLPFLPASVFKSISLTTGDPVALKLTLTSSGTTGRPVSRVKLDNATAMRQLRALLTIMSELIGTRPIPLLVLDSPMVLSDACNPKYPGRVGGVQGFSMISSERSFALDDQMQPNIEEIEAFLQIADGRPFLVYGFTSVIYQNFIESLLASGVRLDLSRGILVHGGGWKKLVARQITNLEFRSLLHDLAGISRVHNYYGMVEQMGSIHLECDRGHLHCSAFSDILVRRGADFSVCPPGEPGILQTMSALPTSYPGHNLLTEDEGVLLGEDDCSCGWSGKYFKVLGRLPEAESKGCSDVGTFVLSN